MVICKLAEHIEQEHVICLMGSLYTDLLLMNLNERHSADRMQVLYSIETVHWLVQPGTG